MNMVGEHSRISGCFLCAETEVTTWIDAKGARIALANKRKEVAIRTMRAMQTLQLVLLKGEQRKA